MSGNEPRPAGPQPPPAGGFGGAPFTGVPEIVGDSRPNHGRPGRALHTIFIALGLFMTALVALTGWGVWKKQRDIRAAEPKNTLGTLAKYVVSARERETWPCPSAGPTPTNFELVRGGRAYQSSLDEWHRDPGWACLKFEMSDPQHYQYRVDVSGDDVTITAVGESTFTFRGHIDPRLHVFQFDPRIEETKN